MITYLSNVTGLLLMAYDMLSEVIIACVLMVLRTMAAFG
jgi:hypothetical protein